MNLYLVEKQKSLLNLDSTPDIKVSGSFREYYEVLNKRLKHLHNFLLNFQIQEVSYDKQRKGIFPVQ